MIGMVGVLGLGLAGTLWFAYKRQANSPAYQPEGKIRWSDEETEE